MLGYRERRPCLTFVAGDMQGDSAYTEQPGPPPAYEHRNGQGCAPELEPGLGWAGDSEGELWVGWLGHSLLYLTGKPVSRIE